MAARPIGGVNAGVAPTQLDAIGVSNVPEPASVSALLLGGGMLLGRRRRDSRRA
jgi:hypothetical protein